MPRLNPLVCLNARPRRDPLSTLIRARCPAAAPRPRASRAAAFLCVPRALGHQMARRAVAPASSRCGWFRQGPTESSLPRPARPHIQTHPIYTPWPPVPLDPPSHITWNPPSHPYYPFFQSHQSPSLRMRVPATIAPPECAEKLDTNSHRLACHYQLSACPNVERQPEPSSTPPPPP